MVYWSFPEGSSFVDVLVCACVGFVLCCSLSYGKYLFASVVSFLCVCTLGFVLVLLGSLLMVTSHLCFNSV